MISHLRLFVKCRHFYCASSFAYWLLFPTVPSV